MNDYFAAIIWTTDIEEQAIKYFFKWKVKHFKNDDCIYYVTTLNVKGKQRKIIGARQDEYGMTAAAAISMKLIFHAKPKYLIMAGITAGTNKEKQFYGDVILASKVWNCTNGKYVDPKVKKSSENYIFESRPIIIGADSCLIPTLKEAINSKSNETTVHVGPLASGTAVIANEHILQNYIVDKLPETQGIDMEAYGVIYAAKHALNPKPHPIIAKGISDFGNKDKDDKYQKFAAYTSCEFIKYLLQEKLDV